MYGPAVRCKRFHRSGRCGLASMYPASAWSVCSGPSWISARMRSDYRTANIDADHGDCAVALLRHGVLLVFAALGKLLSLAGREHGRTIPLPEAQTCAARTAIEAGASSIDFCRRAEITRLCKADLSLILSV